MPPPTLDPPAPSEQGKQARDYLAFHGLVPRTPSLRTSDYNVALSDPFLYYLTRRLGLTRALSWSEALSRGSWFHKAMELSSLSPFALPLEPPLEFNSVLSARLTEIKETARHLGISWEGISKLHARETEDAHTAWAWWVSTCSRPIGGHPSLTRQLSAPYYQILGRELDISCPHPHRKGLTLATRSDMLLYHTTQKGLWVLDAKTTSLPCSIRLSSCPFEFQTLHSLFILRTMLEDGSLFTQPWAKSLPRDIHIAGMIHWAVRKPPLKFGKSDRPFTLDTSPFKSGPRKGQPRNKRIYLPGSEPDLPSYIRRISTWYSATEMYTHLLPDHEADSPVNISRTLASVLDVPTRFPYTDMLEIVSELATRDPLPENFAPSPSGPFSRRGFSDFAPFYFKPVADWPSIIQEEGFIYAKSNDLPQDLPEDAEGAVSEDYSEEDSSPDDMAEDP